MNLYKFFHERTYDRKKIASECRNRSTTIMEHFIKIVIAKYYDRFNPHVSEWIKEIATRLDEINGFDVKSSGRLKEEDYISEIFDGKVESINEAIDNVTKFLRKELDYGSVVTASKIDAISNDLYNLYNTIKVPISGVLSNPKNIYKRESFIEDITNYLSELGII